MNLNYKPTVKKLLIPNWVKIEAMECAKGLDKNRTFNRKVGKLDDLYRSCIGQIMYHLWLKEKKIPHLYMKPYHPEGRPEKEFDIIITDLGEFDVKCRGRWKEQWAHNIEILMAEQEREPRLKVDFYLFATTDEEVKYVYLLGGLSYIHLWKKLHEPKDRKYPFPPAGYIISRELDTLDKIILRV